MNTVSLSVAFIGGVVSFLSPCILPIVPGFLAYLAGTTTANASASRREVFLNALFFVFGFTLVFSVAGVALQTVLLYVSYASRIWLARGGGVIIVVFGLYLAKLLPLPFLEREYRFRVVPGLHGRSLTSFLFGAAFAAGWTPCIGAVLGAILTLAISSPGSAFLLLLAYSLGIGLPFLVVGLFAAAAQSYITRYTGTLRYVSIAFGLLLVVMGVLVFTQRLEYLITW
jgi:cytochrome c-type biogenesis protein